MKKGTFRRQIKKFGTGLWIYIPGDIKNKLELKSEDYVVVELKKARKETRVPKFFLIRDECDIEIIKKLISTKYCIVKNSELKDIKNKYSNDVFNQSIRRLEKNRVIERTGMSFRLHQFRKFKIVEQEKDAVLNLDCQDKIREFVCTVCGCRFVTDDEIPSCPWCDDDPQVIEIKGIEETSISDNKEELNKIFFDEEEKDDVN